MNKDLIKLILAQPYRYRDGQWYKLGKPCKASTACTALRKAINDTLGEVSEEQLQLAALEDLQLDIAEVSNLFIESSIYLKHFYWRASAGTLMLYYSPFGTKELVSLQLSQDEGYKSFLNAIREVPSWLNALLLDFDQSNQQKPKLTLDQFASQLFKQLIITPSQQLTEEPKSLSWSREEFCFKYFKLEELTSTATPKWDEFLDRLSNKEVFLAFVWSVFEQQNFGRQVLWLKGPGNDGKSRVISAISRYLGNHAVAALSQGTVTSQFFSSFVYGKRLVVFGDCMHTRLISTGAIHTLVGNDYASIEAKGKQAFAGKIYAKVIVGSNYAPEIDNTANQVSRLLYVTVKPIAKDKSSLLPQGDDATFEDSLVQEMPSLLYKARQAYEQRCKQHGRITLSNEEVEEMLTKTKSDMQEFIEKFCENNLTVAGDSSINCAELNSYFLFEAQASGIKTNQQLDLNLLNRYIEEKLGLEKRRENGHRVWGDVRMGSRFQSFMESKVLS